MTRQTQVRRDAHAARAIELGPQHLAERRRCDSRGPQHGAGDDALAAEREEAIPDLGDRRARADFDTEPRELPPGLFR
jgi:hypothetical protein